MLKQLPVLLAFAHFCHAAPAAPDTSWRLVSRKGTISVYNKSVPGQAMDAFKGVGSGNVPMAVLEKALLDLPGYLTWVPNLKQSRIVKHLSPDSFLAYLRFSVPMPFEDRDILVQVDIARNGPGGRITAAMKAVNDRICPPVKGVVRITKMTGEIMARPLSATVTEGSYSERLDLDGNVPGWVNGIIAKEIPPKILANLMAECQRRMDAAKGK